MLRFATTAGLALAAANIRSRIRALSIRVALAAVGALFLIGAASFALVAAYLGLQPRLGPIGAAGAIAFALLLIGLVFLFFAQRAPREQIREMDHAASGSLQDQYAQLGRALSSGGTLSNPVVLIAGAALVAGYLFGRRGKR